MTVPSLLYGLEASTMRKTDQQKIQPSQMEFLTVITGHRYQTKKELGHSKIIKCNRFKQQS